MKKSLYVFFLIYLSAFSQSLLAQEESKKIEKTRSVNEVSNTDTDQKFYADGSFALVIGNSDYYEWDKLEGVLTDVKEVRKTLEAQGFNVAVETNLKSKELQDRIENFNITHGYKKDARLLIYFAGHGDTRTSADGRKLGYIIPIDTPKFSRDERGFRQKAISMDKIEGWAKQIEAKHALFVFDSCFSGKLISRSDIVYPEIVKESLSHPVRQFITSGAETQKVSDDSFFRRMFVEGLKGDADLSGDGFVAASELAYFLKDRVTGYTRRTQTPQYGTIRDAALDRGDMIFTVPEESKRKNLEKAAQAYKNVVKNDTDALRSFISVYSNSPQANEARETLAKLEPIAKLTRSSENVEEKNNSINFRKYNFSTVQTNYLGAETKTENTAEYFSEDLDGGIDLRMTKIVGGKFKMGSNAAAEEKPIHEVELQDFLISTTEITQEQWQIVADSPKIKIALPKNPSYFKGAKLPVESITWEEAVEFCERLSRLTKREYRLPTESEWEYAARGGTTSDFAFGERIGANNINFNASIDSPKVVSGMFRRETIEVGSLGIANSFGLFDMHGNVAEWCADVWQNNYLNAPKDGSAVMFDSNRYVIRGGSWASIAPNLRTSYRTSELKQQSSDKIGFRVVLKK